MSYDDSLMLQKNKNDEYPLDLAIKFHNEPMKSFITDVLQFQYKIPPFETLYLKFSETKDSNDKQAVTDQVIELLSEKMKNASMSVQEDDGEEEEADDNHQDQYINDPNIMQ